MTILATARQGFCGYIYIYIYIRGCISLFVCCMTNMAQKPLPATPKNVGTICKMKTKNTENTYKKDNQEHYVKEENEDTTVNKRKCEHMNERILDSNDHHLEQHVSIILARDSLVSLISRETIRMRSLISH